MKKLLLMILFLIPSFLVYSQKGTYTFQDLVIQRGGNTTVTFPNTGYSNSGFITDQLGSSIYFERESFWGDLATYNTHGKIYGIGRGCGIFVTFDSYKKYIIYKVKVVDVVKIDIPDNLDMVAGESYTYTPIITDSEAETTLTWTSSNTSVATVNSSGMVTVASPGQTTITCTASNGIKAQSIVTVSPLLLSDVTLDKQSHEMSVGDNVQLTTTYSPADATTKAVKWMSGNDNVAQVDSEGNVTAIAPGYCSIYAIASDGSGKFDKCLIHVTGTGDVKGDINGDGGVTPQDASMILQYIAKKITW